MPSKEIRSEERELLGGLGDRSHGIRPLSPADHRTSFAFWKEGVSCGSSKCSCSASREMACNSKTAVHTKMMNSQLGEGKRTGVHFFHM